MSYRLFISYSSKDQWVIPELEKLIVTVRPDAEIFCSATGSIHSGENYVNSIFDHLHLADVFIGIISNNYWKSRYCIVELGAAYLRHKYDPEKQIDIHPLLLPPLDKSMAMANTPLTEIQVTNLTDTGELTDFLRKMAGPENEAKVDALQVKIAEYVHMLKTTLLTAASLTESAEANAYYDEPAANPVNKDSVVRVNRKENETFEFGFNLSRLSYTPSFISMALEYLKKVNLQEYLRFDRDASFRFRLSNVDDPEDPEDAGVLEAIDVEFKSGPNHNVFKRINRKLNPGENQLSIPLYCLDSDPLSEVNQICFVAHPRTDLKKADGVVVIDQIHVEFGDRNILAE